jgi:hypothetical protein
VLLSGEQFQSDLHSSFIRLSLLRELFTVASRSFAVILGTNPAVASLHGCASEECCYFSQGTSILLFI